MIVWLASYPRSGNTLLRMILKSVFGQETYSKYNDLYDIGADPETMNLVGHKFIDKSWAEAYQQMKEADKIYFVKTHDYPEDDSSAVYIVRNGRASIISYLHYFKDFNSVEYPLADIIAGYVRFGSWGSHLDAWNPLERPNTFLVKYESLLSDSEKEIKRLSDLLECIPSGHWKNNFEHFHKINPKFFREGTVKKDHEIKSEDLELFLLFHGDWMNALGYDKKDRVSTQIGYHLRGMTSRIYKKFEDSRKGYNKINSERHKLIEERKGLITQNARLTAEKDNLTDEKERLVTQYERKIDQLQSNLQQKEEQINRLNEKLKQSEASKNTLEAELDQKTREITENYNQLEQKENIIKQMQEQSAHIEEMITKLQEQSRRVEGKISQLHGQIKEQEEIFRKKSGELIAERRSLETVLNQRDERIADLLHSWSWKITKPLRTFGDLFRRK